MTNYSGCFDNVKELYEGAEGALRFLNTAQFLDMGNGFHQSFVMWSPQLQNRDYCVQLGRDFEREMREIFTDMQKPNGCTLTVAN